MTPEVLAPLNPVEITAAAQTRLQIDGLVVAIANHQKAIESNFVTLGRLLGDVNEQRHWITYGFKSFSAYLESLGDRINKKRSQLHNMMSAATRLAPLPESDLIDLGVTKATMLARVVQYQGHLPSQELIGKAKTMTCEQLEPEVTVAAGLCEPEDSKHMFGLGYIFLTPEEREEFIKACKLAAADPEYPLEFSNWQQASPSVKKEILMRWAQEFRSSNGGQGDADQQRSRHR